MAQELLNERLMLDDIAAALGLDPLWRDSRHKPEPQMVLDNLRRYGLTIVRI